MKKFIIVLLIGLFSLSACEQAERITYTEKPGLYFDIESGENELNYSLLGSLYEIDTVSIPIKIMGNSITYSGRYKVVVVEEESTAIEGVHYVKFNTEYQFGENQFEDLFEIELLKGDPILESESRVLTFAIVESDDFGLGYTEKTKFKLTFTNQMIKPSYWDMPLLLYFGVYSKVKHNLAINILGHDFPLTLTEAINPPYSFSYWMVAGRAVCQYVIENDVYDENNNKIMPWATF